jgi:amidase
LILDAHPAAAVDSEIAAALHKVGDVLEKHGAKVSRKSELLPDLMETLGCFGKILGTVTSRGVPQERPMTAHEWMDALDQQYAIRQKWARLFSAFEVVLAPAFGVVAFPHDDSQGERKLVINGLSTEYGVQGAWSSMAGLANLPATAVPVGKTTDNLPIGIQIIGRFLGDRTTIHLARLLERDIGGFEPPPLK